MDDGLRSGREKVGVGGEGRVKETQNISSCFLGEGSLGCTTRQPRDKKLPKERNHKQSE